MTFGFPPPPTTDSASRLSRTLQPAEWSAAGIPLLRDPRQTVTELCELHGTAFATTIVGVLGAQGRTEASASVALRPEDPDGWEFRNALLLRLRQVIPHDLRRRVPVRTGILVHCRNGSHDWTEADGAWMWGLHDACTLHGLRCGAYVSVTPDGWQIFGEERNGRHPRATAPAPEEPSETSVDGKVRASSALTPPRAHPA